MKVMIQYNTSFVFRGACDKKRVPGKLSCEYVILGMFRNAFAGEHCNHLMSIFWEDGSPSILEDHGNLSNVCILLGEALRNKFGGALKMFFLFF